MLAHLTHFGHLSYVVHLSPQIHVLHLCRLIINLLSVSVGFISQKHGYINKRCFRLLVIEIPNNCYIIFLLRARSSSCGCSHGMCVGVYISDKY